MRAWVAVTDSDWFRFLSSLPGVDEVNFWQPSGGRRFAVLQPGEILLFKLHAPERAIVGGGFFAGHSVVPAAMAWDSFGQKNGAATFDDMVRRIEWYSRGPVGPEHPVGCIILEQPFFWEQKDWMPEPADWKPSIVQGKSYDLTAAPVGTWLWEQVQFRLLTAPVDLEEPVEASVFGEPRLVRPRLGQGSFKILVADAYHRRCAVTGEKILPVLEAAHIRPVSSGGLHRIDNGMLLRSDVHTLFDRGYVTVTPDHRLRVSTRLRDEFDNGAYYLNMDGAAISLPERSDDRPDIAALEWHSDEVFRP
jgi:putative restriction endonuclease